MSTAGVSKFRSRLDIFEIVERRDRQMARIFDNPKRSNALTMLAQMRSQGLLMEDEYFSSSPETRGVIELLRDTMVKPEQTAP
jgi:hypothetical protein